MEADHGKYTVPTLNKKRNYIKREGRKKIEKLWKRRRSKRD